MAITSRMLKPGERLAANYREQTHYVDVVEYEGNGMAFRLETGDVFTSLSAAGSHVMGGISCNGWRFWSRVDDLRPPRQLAGRPAPATQRPKPQPNRNLRPIPSVSATTPAWWCSICLAPFTHQEPGAPGQCLAGHPEHMTAQVEVVS